jgi:coenzyme F420-reducing hydrogenase alpha subunit
LRESLEWARGAALETIEWARAFDFPSLSRDVEFVALRHGSEYPMNEGRVVSSRGLDITPDEFLEHFEEHHVPHSTALHARLKEGGAYVVGPMARLFLNADRLPDDLRQLVDELGLTEERNPFRSILVRGVETVYACEEALSLIERYEPPAAPAVAVTLRHGIGHACTEAPRGLLYHRYDVGSDGSIVDARIMPPTSQNQRTIEEDLHACVVANVDLEDDALGSLCERAIRNYDPCISCSTHFLRLSIDRG